MKQKYKDRLLKLAHLLEEISDEIWYTDPQEIVFLDEESQDAVTAFYHRWAFYECPYLFKEWHYKGSTPIHFENTKEWSELPDAPVHDLASEGKGTVWSAMIFFGIEDPELFLHLFGAEKGIQQPEKYGGKAYPAPTEISGKDIAFNIKEYTTKNNKQHEG